MVPELSSPLNLTYCGASWDRAEYTTNGCHRKSELNRPLVRAAKTIAKESERPRDVSVECTQEDPFDIGVIVVQSRRFRIPHLAVAALRWCRGS